MSDTPAERREAAATRRRWVTLAEVLAVAGVVIAALTLWQSWSDRRTDAQVRQDERRTAQAQAAAERRHIGLIATDSGGDTLSFKGVACAVQATTLTFPSALDVPPRSTVTVHAIEADWFAAPLLAMTDGGADRREGRMPVLIESGCQDEDGERGESAIYDIAYRIHPRLLRGRAVEVRGLVLREAVDDARAKRRLDAAWAREKPA